MRAVNREFIYVTASAGLPALGNFVAVTLALHHLDPVLLGRSYALLALLYVAIDAFNFGSSRIYTIERIRARFASLIRLDAISATASTMLFCIACWVLGRSDTIIIPHWPVMLVLAPACYGLSHFSLGFFRIFRKSIVVCVVSTVSALSRVSVVILLIEIRDWRPLLPDFLLLIEAAYGAMLLGCYLWFRRSVAGQVEPQRAEDNRGIFGWYRHFFSHARDEVLSSWYANAIFSGAKHVDVLIVSVLVGPAGAALYRAVKSINNLAFNFGQSLSLAMHGSWIVVAEAFRENAVRRRLALCAIVSIAILIAASYGLLKVKLFPTSSLGSETAQWGFLFAVLSGALLVLLCRIVSLYLYACSKTAFVKMSSMEVIVTLGAVSLLGWKMGVGGAVSGVGIASFAILLSSAFLLIRVGERSVTA
ncbi:hypothetical protein [Burkholderia sp. A9]|uniref:hypothetical protein n=1 Tax=Burkholderia sp. A9 TaxID=1365108 RepID=UPI000693D6B6|nr:hypothetical protein [Burkholderia sp. A9]